MSFNRLIGTAMIAAVIGGLAAAFTFLGTPAHQRLVALDDRRIEDLQRTASLLHDRYTSGGLPARLPPSMVLSDPVSKQNYEYSRIDSKHYVLCAVFATGEPADRGQVYPPRALWIARSWHHGAGRACFELDVTASPPSPPRSLSVRLEDDDDTTLTP